MAKPGTLDLNKQATLGIDNQAALSTPGILHNARHVKKDHNYIRDLEKIIQSIQKSGL